MDMNILKHIPRWAKNKYLVVSLLFLLFVLFLDSRNIFNQYSRYRELKNLEKSHRELSRLNKELERDNRQLQTDHTEIEKVAREKYYMKRKNETVFLFSDAEPRQKNGGTQ
jgi:cell division protein DivIC